MAKKQAIQTPAPTPRRKSGPKPKGGSYCQVPIRVESASDMDAIFDLSPSERGAAILAGMKQGAHHGA